MSSKCSLNLEFDLFPYLSDVVLNYAALLIVHHKSFEEEDKEQDNSIAELIENIRFKPARTCNKG